MRNHWTLHPWREDTILRYAQIDYYHECTYTCSDTHIIRMLCVGLFLLWLIFLIGDAIFLIRPLILSVQYKNVFNLYVVTTFYTEIGYDYRPRRIYLKYRPSCECTHVFIETIIGSVLTLVVFSSTTSSTLFSGRVCLVETKLEWRPIHGRRERTPPFNKTPRWLWSARPGGRHEQRSHTPSD